MCDETTEYGMMIERVKELRDRVKKANDSPWMTGAYEHDIDTMNEAISALERPCASAYELQQAFERGFNAGLREGETNKCAACNGSGVIPRSGDRFIRCDACDGRGH